MSQLTDARLPLDPTQDAALDQLVALPDRSGPNDFITKVGGEFVMETATGGGGADTRAYDISANSPVGGAPHSIADTFLGLLYNSQTEAGVLSYFDEPVSVDKLILNVAQNTNTNPTTLTLRKNGVDTAYSITVPALTTGNFYLDVGEAYGTTDTFSLRGSTTIATGYTNIGNIKVIVTVSTGTPLGVQSVTGASVDNTDPFNPVINTTTQQTYTMNFSAPSPIGGNIIWSPTSVVTKNDESYAYYKAVGTNLSQVNQAMSAANSYNYTDGTLFGNGGPYVCSEYTTMIMPGGPYPVMPECSFNITPLVDGVAAGVGQFISYNDGDLPKWEKKNFAGISIPTGSLLSFKVEPVEDIIAVQLSGNQPTNFPQGDNITSNYGGNFYVLRQMTTTLVLTASTPTPAQRIVGATSGAIGFVTENRGGSTSMAVTMGPQSPQSLFIAGEQINGDVSGPGFATISTFSGGILLLESTTTPVVMGPSPWTLTSFAAGKVQDAVITTAPFTADITAYVTNF